METMIIKNINIINENAEVSENMDVFVENGVITRSLCLPGDIIPELS